MWRSARGFRGQSPFKGSHVGRGILGRGILGHGLLKRCFERLVERSCLKQRFVGRGGRAVGTHTVPNRLSQQVGLVHRLAVGPLRGRMIASEARRGPRNVVM